MKVIYVIGAQCTGKTTLIEALGTWLKQNMPQTSFTIIRETARVILQLHQFTRDDVRAGGERCLHLQKLILQRQSALERQHQGVNLVLSDRSGIDPLVYAQMYCDEEAVGEMERSKAWLELREKMSKESVIVCEPVKEWLFDDGTRLMPKDINEWTATHKLFCESLCHHQIPFVVLPASTTGIDARVDFVISCLGL